MHHMMIVSLFFLDVLRNVGSSPIISSSSSLFGGSSNQSPVGGTPIQLSNCSTQPPTTSSSLQQNNSQLQHTTYVDQRGRSTLIKPTTPARELPVQMYEFPYRNIGSQQNCQFVIILFCIMLQCIIELLVFSYASIVISNGSCYFFPKSKMILRMVSARCDILY